MLKDRQKSRAAARKIQSRFAETRFTEFLKSTYSLS